jgi:hypothetical protein
MTSERDTDFSAASAAKRLVEAEAQLKFYKDREEHFARVLMVSDGGQYRADWDSRIKAIIAERDQAIEETRVMRDTVRECVQVALDAALGEVEFGDSCASQTVLAAGLEAGENRRRLRLGERPRVFGDPPETKSEAKRLEHELREVVRAFEKFGEADALADANGNVTPYIGVLRVLERLREAERDAFQLGLLFARVCGQVQNKLPYISATLAPGNRRALTHDMCSIDGARANQSYVFLQELSKIVSKAVEEAKTGAEKNETRDDPR